MKKTILSVKEVSKIYDQGTCPVEILNNVSIEFIEGDFTVIMGSSGTGKSTLLYTISGMESVSSGSVFYMNQDITSVKEKTMAELRSKEFGFIFQQPNLVSTLSLKENILVAGFMNPSNDSKKIILRAEELLTRMNVTDAKNRFPNEVSGGEAQRAAVARAIIHSPNVVFADEPTGALNKQNTIEVLNLLTSLHQEGQTIIMVTHDIHAAARGNRVLYLEDGQIKGELKLEKDSVPTNTSKEEHLTAWLNTMEW